MKTLSTPVVALVRGIFEGLCSLKRRH